MEQASVMLRFFTFSPCAIFTLMDFVSVIFFANGYYGTDGYTQERAINWGKNNKFGVLCSFFAVISDFTFLSMRCEIL
jgi:hypothetical protein